MVLNEFADHQWRQDARGFIQCPAGPWKHASVQIARGDTRAIDVRLRVYRCQLGEWRTQQIQDLAVYEWRVIRPELGMRCWIITSTSAVRKDFRDRSQKLDGVVSITRRPAFAFLSMRSGRNRRATVPRRAIRL